MIIIGIALVLTPGASPAQNNRISWFGVDGSFSASSTRAVHVKSILAQGLAGATRQHNSVIEAGFLADTLFRSVVTGVLPFREPPRSFVLYQNFPNPFNPRTRIRYDLPLKSTIRITVFTILGQRVIVLLEGVQDAGSHEVEFDGASLASGVYFYRLVAGQFVETKRLMLLR